MQQQRILELDGIRGLAIIAVMIFHLAQYRPAHPDVLSGAIDLGWIGVDLFFVLSGFLITSVLLSEKGSPHYLRNFFVRRALRILPLYYLVVLCFFHLELPVAHHFHALRYFTNDSEPLYWLQLSNWRSAFGELASSPVGPFWSLAIEEQFYIVWPFVVLWSSERGLMIVCIVIAAVSASLRFLPPFQAIDASNAEFLYRLTPFRLEPLCYGALLALLPTHAEQNSRLERWMISACIGGALILLAAVTAGGNATKYSNPMVATYGFTGVDLLCAGLVGLAIVSRDRHGLTAFLRNSTLRRFGKLSYALYVFHIQVAILLTFATAKLIGGGLLTSFINISVGIAFAYLLAACSWRWIEAPLLSVKDRLAPPAPPQSAATLEQPFASVEPAAVSGQQQAANQ
jgi:peptidoglycan/LPS O-acetylase OafA/YrhL